MTNRDVPNAERKSCPVDLAHLTPEMLTENMAPETCVDGSYICQGCRQSVGYGALHSCPGLLGQSKENLLREILTELRALRQELKVSKGK